MRLRNKRGLFVNKKGGYSVKTKPWHIKPLSSTTQPILYRTNCVNYLKPTPSEFECWAPVVKQHVLLKGCKFIVSSDGELFKFCNKPRAEGKPYCATHVACCYTTIVDTALDGISDLWGNRS